MLFHFPWNVSHSWFHKQTNFHWIQIFCRGKFTFPSFPWLNKRKLVFPDLSGLFLAPSDTTIITNVSTHSCNWLKCFQGQSKGFNAEVFKTQFFITKCNNYYINSLNRQCHSSSNQNYYDVLNLKRDCSDKDIRKSFVKLSKQLHPDTNSSIKDGAQFTKIMEAYKILGKTESRAAYDHSLQFNYSYHKPISVEYDGQIFRPNKYGFPNESAPPRPKQPYYGVQGLKRLPNKYIVLFCLVWAGVGITAQYFAIRYLYFNLKYVENTNLKTKLPLQTFSYV